MHALHAICLTALVLTFADVQDPSPPRTLPPKGRLAHVVSVVPASPSALVTWATRVNHQGVHVLDLLVVWKGSEGWYSKGPSGGGSGGGTGRWFEFTARYGGLELHAKLDSIERIAEIQGRRVVLRGANVILVDGVDSPNGLRVTGMLRVDPDVPLDEDGLPRIADVWTRSLEIVAFVKR